MRTSFWQTITSTTKKLRLSCRCEGGAGCLRVRRELQSRSWAAIRRHLRRVAAVKFSTRASALGGRSYLPQPKARDGTGLAQLVCGTRGACHDETLSHCCSRRGVMLRRRTACICRSRLRRAGLDAALSHAKAIHCGRTNRLEAIHLPIWANLRASPSSFGYTYSPWLSHFSSSHLSC